MSMEIKKLGGSDLGAFVQLIRLFEEVFEMKDFKLPDENYLQHLLQSDGFFVFVAVQEEEIVGGLTAYTLHQYYSRSPLIYIYDLAVKVKMQRKGIGKKLIAGVNNYAKSLGAEAVMVEAEEPDHHAIEFYRSTGAAGQKTVHFEYTL